MIKSIQQVREEFSANGISIAEWARDNHFSPDLVYRILKNNRVPKRGESHKIAVKLGIKDIRANLRLKLLKYIIIIA
ncbi:MULTISPECIES: DNA-binding protein [Acinetobacter]|uniref:DNA-binding protein n=1 Tax=Acinetobacter TaxID=469 RepID=UPI0015B57123|nr:MULTISPECIES: DNA-binding protein [Acinetobacter]MBT0888728.1 DNA-binding protein [Acinetobacter towneri]NWJ94135.1 DNA-binding protein [Acinetobacter sp. Swhac1]